MGTVVEKVQYIEVTKQAIKKAIKNKGVDVSDTDTFRSYAEKIKEIGSGSGGSSVAEYEYKEDGNLTSFPRQPLKAEDDFVYTYEPSIWHEGYDNSAAAKYLEDTNEFAIYYYFSDVVNLFDGSDDTACYLGESYRALYFKFAKETKVSQIKLKVTGDTYYPTNGSIHGTNLQAMATTCEASNKVVSFNIPAGIKTPTDMVIDVNQSFKYFGVFSDGAVYACEIIADGRVYTMTLKSANMTPSFKCYFDDYMQVITQDWHNGSEIIPSQTLIFKPYDEGGCLVNYTDDGKATNLKMFLLNPTGETIVTEKKFVQPVLTSNGTIGGDAFAVEMDSQLDADRPAWKAFDGNTVLNSPYTDQLSTTSGHPHWVKFYNPHPLSVSKITIFNGADNCMPLDWEFQYSDDNSEWHTLTSGTNTVLTANGEWSFDVANSGNHKYYRFYTTSGAGTDNSYLGLTEIQITGKEIASVTYDKPIYVLAPDDSFELEGYREKTQVADLNIPERLS